MIMGSGTVRISKKYGLNPSLMVCPICGESVGVAILGANNGKKAPIKMNGDLCDNCKEKYVTIIEVETEANPKPTGRCVYIPKEYINVDCPEGKAIMAAEEFSKTFNHK